MRAKAARPQSGFSLLELMIVMALMVIIVSAIALQIRTAHQRAADERTQTDLFQESREFMDQMARDLRQAGYPNPRNYDSSTLPCTGIGADCASGTVGTASTSTQAAVGLTEAQDTDLWFEGGVDDSGAACNPPTYAAPSTPPTTPCVLFTQYDYNPSTTGGCPCLRRSQMARGGTPNTETPNYTSEVQYVQNYQVNPPVPIFSYYSHGGTVQVVAPSVTGSYSGITSWPVWNGTANSVPDNEILADIDTVVIQLVVQSPTIDTKTGQHPTVTLYSTVKVNNCSQASTGQLSCAN